MRASINGNWFADEPRLIRWGGAPTGIQSLGSSRAAGEIGLKDQRLAGVNLMLGSSAQDVCKAIPKAMTFRGARSFSGLELQHEFRARAEFYACMHKTPSRRGDVVQLILNSCLKRQSF